MYPDSPILHSALWQALRAALTLSEEEASAHILRAWTDAPPAEPSPDESLCYYHLQADASAPLLEETEIAGSVASVSSFIPCRLILVFYGPEAEAWALRCGSFLFLDGPDSPRQILRAVGLYPVPTHAAPAVFYEEIGKTRRKRADLSLPLRLLSNADWPTPVPLISEAPAVSFHLESEGQVP